MKSIRDFFSQPKGRHANPVSRDSHRKTCEEPPLTVGVINDYDVDIKGMDRKGICENQPNDSMDDFVMTTGDNQEHQEWKETKNKSSKHRESCDVNCNSKAENTGSGENVLPPENVVEISYSDFLSGQTGAGYTCNGLAEGDVTSSTPKRKPRRIKPIMVLPPPPEPTLGEEEMAELPKMPDRSLGDITKFFSKDLPTKRKSHQHDVASKIKFSADVHGSPKKSPPPIRHQSHSQKSPMPSNVSASADLSITLLDSCVVTLPDKRVKNKKYLQGKEPVIELDNEDEHSSKIGDGGKSGAVTCVKTPEKSGERKNSSFQNSVLALDKEAKSARQVHLSPRPEDAVFKTQQSVLQFGKSGLLITTTDSNSLVEKDMLDKNLDVKILHEGSKDKEKKTTMTSAKKCEQKTGEMEYFGGSDYNHPKSPNSLLATNTVNAFTLMSTASRQIQAKEKLKEENKLTEKTEKRSDEELSFGQEQEGDSDNSYSVLMTETSSSMKKPMSLKLKFTKLKSTSSKEAKQKKHIKLNHAQRLVQKAKQTDLKKAPIKKGKSKADKQSQSRTAENNAKKAKTGNTAREKMDHHENLRRSNRHCAREAASAISITYQALPSPKILQDGPRSPQTEKKKDKKSSDADSKPRNSSKKKQACKSIIPISSSEDELPIKTTKKKVEKGKTPVKNTRNGTAKKGIKLASIFTQSSNVDKSLDASVEPKSLTGADKAALAVKRTFLLSGLPMNIQQQQKARDVCQLGDYPPLPLVSHVLQTPTKDSPTYSVWKLSEVTLPFKNPVGMNNVKPVDKSSLQSFTKSHEKKVPVELQEREVSISVAAPLDPVVVSWLLAEVRTSNPEFPVKRVYKQVSLRTTSQDISKGGEKHDNGESLHQKKKELGGHKRRRVEIFSDKQSLRRSTRTQSSKYTQEEKEDAAPQPPTLAVAQIERAIAVEISKPQLQWTEKYQPEKGSEQLGNSSTVKKLHSWMVEWKHRLDAEMRKIWKQQLKQLRRGEKSLEEIKKKLGEDWWGNDDEDFALSSDDDSEEEEDDNLCNTILLAGPNGCGKTALVYSLSQELGYQVFEVNASSRRNGRQILSQLQEATQSQQLSKNLDGPVAPCSSRLPVNEAVVQTSAEKKTASAFAGLFKDKKLQDDKRHSMGGKTKESEEKMKKKRKRKSSEVELAKEQYKGVTLPGNQKGLNLCSMTLILFEEVEIVFDDDKGFWAAVDNFMMTTKVPIILTTSDHNFHSRVPFNGRMERFSMKTPLLNNIASHLQLICIAEGSRVSYEEIYALVQHCKGDLRRCLLQLQFLLESGGGVHKQEQSIQYNSLYSTLDKDQVPSVKLSDAGSEDDFDVRRSRPRKNRNVSVVSDESSQESFMTSSKKFLPTLAPMLESQTDDNSSGACSQANTDGTLCTIEPSAKVPLIHMGIFSGMLGLALPESQGNILQSLCSKDLDILASLQLHLHCIGYNLLYSNLLQVLPLPCSASQQNPVPSRLPQQEFRRIKCHYGTWDDSDDDSAFSLSGCQQKAEETQKHTLPKRGSRKKSHGSELVQEILEGLVQMHDGFCDGDILTSSRLEDSRYCGCSWQRGSLMSGQYEQLTSSSEKRYGTSDLICYLQAVTVTKACQQTQNVLHTIKSIKPDDGEIIMDSLTLPVASTLHTLKLSRQTTNEQRISHRHSECVENIARTLPACVYNQQRAIAVDYMPVIRNIFRVEQLRKAYSKKRRFFHYLDEMVSSLRPTYVDTLTTSFS